MNTYEKSLIKDTSFSAGLLAIAVAWIAFAAVQSPVAAPEHSATMTAQNSVAYVRS